MNFTWRRKLRRNFIRAIGFSVAAIFLFLHAYWTISSDNDIDYSPRLDADYESSQDSEGGIRIFDRAAFDSAVANMKTKVTKCVKTKVWRAKFAICVHSKARDEFISGSFLSGMPWERHVATIVGKMLRAFNGPNNVLVDVGANIGSIALVAAALKFEVFAVEPLKANNVRMFQSRELNQFEDRLRLIRNAVDFQRGRVKMTTMEKNIGGSFVQDEDDKEASGEFVDAVTLQDVFDFVHSDFYVDGGKKINVVLKIDVETYECRAFLGSKFLFDDPRFFIAFIVMEWNFRTKSGFCEACNGTMVDRLTLFFTENGYKPFDEYLSRSTPLDVSRSRDWPHGNVIWIHEAAPKVDSYSEIGTLLAETFLASS